MVCHHDRRIFSNLDAFDDYLARRGAGPAYDFGYGYRFTIGDDSWYVEKNQIDDEEDIFDSPGEQPKPTDVSRYTQFGKWQAQSGSGDLYKDIRKMGYKEFTGKYTQISGKHITSVKSLDGMIRGTYRALERGGDQIAADNLRSAYEHRKWK